MIDSRGNEEPNIDFYLCATFRNEWSRAFNLKLGSAIEKRGLTCFLPQRDSDQSGDSLRTFREDVAGIDGARCVIAIGAKLQSSNWGFEVGYAYGTGKPVIALTDRAHPLELMTAGAVTAVLTAENLDAIEEYLDSLLEAARVATRR